jgi:nucleotidyltransferase/DNA polymerase involved in DNA repair
LPSPEPCAVAERQRILVCDAKAVARGLRAGMPVSAALALAPNLRLRELAALHREQPRPGHIKRIARARGKRNAH